MRREERGRGTAKTERMSWEDKLTGFFQTDKLKIKETIGSFWLTVVLAVLSFLQIATIFPITPLLLVSKSVRGFLFCFTEQNKHVWSVVSVALSLLPPSALTRKKKKTSVSFKLSLSWKNSALCLSSQLSNRCRKSYFIYSTLRCLHWWIVFRRHFYSNYVNIIR